jgi:WD40 repeat protein
VLIDKKNDFLFSASYSDNQILIWNYLNGRIISRFDGHKGNILNMELFKIPLSWNEFTDKNFIFNFN